MIKALQPLALVPSILTAFAASPHPWAVPSRGNSWDAATPELKIATNLACNECEQLTLKALRLPYPKTPSLPFWRRSTISGRTVRIVALVAYALALAWLAFWRRWPERLLKRTHKPAFLEGLRKRKVFSIFNKASTLDYLRVAVMRTPIHFTIIISMYVVLHTFNAVIPFTKILGNIPLTFLVGTLPITPGGLGTTNAVMVALLSPYLTGPVFASGSVGPKELLFAASLLWMFANYSMKVIVGSFFLRRVSSSLFKPTQDFPEEKAEHEASHLGGNY